MNRAHLKLVEPVAVPDPQPAETRQREPHGPQAGAGGRPNRAPQWMIDEGAAAFRNTRAARRYRLAIVCVWASTFALALLAFKAAL